MTTIWKTELHNTTQQFIEVPEGAEMLCAREQRGRVCVWYRCNPENNRTQREIYISGTGISGVCDGRYLGTALLHDGTLALHVFEERNCAATATSGVGLTLGGP
jgi:hypothetical protein